MDRVPFARERFSSRRAFFRWVLISDRPTRVERRSRSARHRVDSWASGLVSDAFTASTVNETRKPRP